MIYGGFLDLRNSALQVVKSKYGFVKLNYESYRAVTWVSNSGHIENP